MKKIILITMVFTLLLTMMIPVFADEVTTESTTEEVTESTLYIESGQSLLNDGGLVEDVQMEDVVGHIEKKGWEVVGFIKTINQPVMVIFFLIGLFFIVMGALGNSSLMGRGLLTLFVVAIVYASVFFAEDILSVFNEWIKM